MRLYDANDYETVKSWCLMRNMERPVPSDFPKIGLIEDGLAVGFLIETNSSTGFLDFFISNPEREYMERSRAIDSIATALIEKAKDLGFKRVQCSTRLSGVAKKALSLGFRDIGQFRSFVRGL